MKVSIILTFLVISLPFTLVDSCHAGPATAAGNVQNQGKYRPLHIRYIKAQNVPDEAEREASGDE